MVFGAAVDLPGRDNLDEIVCEVALDGQRMGRLNDDRAVESRIEHRFVVVSVIDERARLIGHEAVHEVAARRNERLRDAADAVHVDGNVVNPMKVDRIGRRAVVRVVDDDRVALLHLQHWPRNDAIVRVGHHRKAWFDRPRRLAFDEMEYLDAPARSRNGLIGAVGPRNAPGLARGGGRNRNNAAQRLQTERGRVRRGDVVGVGSRDCRNGSERDERRADQQGGPKKRHFRCA